MWSFVLEGRSLSFLVATETTLDIAQRRSVHYPLKIYWDYVRGYVSGILALAPRPPRDYVRVFESVSV